MMVFSHDLLDKCLNFKYFVWYLLSMYMYVYVYMYMHIGDMYACLCMYSIGSVFTCMV